MGPTVSNNNAISTEYKWYTQNDTPPNVAYLIQNPTTIGTAGTYYVNFNTTVSNSLYGKKVT
jgi:hypothetical protein